jgi:hypothetical protein
LTPTILKALGDYLQAKVYGKGRHPHQMRLNDGLKRRWFWLEKAALTPDQK